MEFGISTLCLGDTPLAPESLEIVRKSGFKRIELHANRPAFDFHNRALVRSVAQWLSENEMPPPSLHLPFEEALGSGQTRPLSILDRTLRDRQFALDEIKRCLELLERVETRYVVLHLGVTGQDFDPLAFEYAYAAITAIQTFSGARVLIENLENGIAIPERILEFVAVAQLRDVGICYDIGHGDVLEAFKTPASAFHINDNDGVSDLHQWPFAGKTRWPQFVDELVVANYDGPLILEARDTRIETGREAMNRLQDLIDEARNSVEEFRLKYKLPHGNVEEN